MQRNYMTITYAYHFIAEAVIILFLSIPIFHYNYGTTPYISYTLIMLIASIIYIIMLHRVTSYIPYLMIAPILGGVFYILDYPLWISIIFAVLLTRSAITLRNERKLENEGAYLRIILAASILIPLFIHDVPFIIFVVSTLLFLIVGNTVRNMTVLPKQDRRSKSTWFLTSMLGIVIIVITMMYFSFNGVRTVIGFIWASITSILAKIGSLFIYLLSLIPLPEGDVDENDEIEGGAPEAPPEYYDDSTTMVDHVFTWIFIIVCMIAAFFIIRFVMRLMKRNFKKAIYDEDHISYEEIGSLNKEKKSWGDRFRSLRNLPKDHVRKRMYQFEKKMSTTDHGRKQEETIEEWVRRTGWNIDFNLYQRVRYGTNEGTKEEAETLKQQLTKIEEIEEKKTQE